MAGRTSAGVGTIILVVVLGVLSLALFVTTTLFFAQANSARQQLRSKDAEVAEFVQASEKNLNEVRQLLDQAKRERKSLVRYMSDSYADAMVKTTGSRTDTPTTFAEKVQQIPGADAASLFTIIGNQRQSIDTLTLARDEAERARQAALADRQAESERVKAIQAQHQQTINALNEDIGQYKSEVEQYREGVNEARGQMESRVARIEQEARDREARLREDVNRLREENLVLNNQLAILRGEKNQDILRGADEYALVDGSVVGLNSADNQAFISLGAEQKVVLGMTFAVYADASAIRPNENGEYPRGKAALEVISVGPRTSVCRILFETKGAPVVPGDVIANAVYDPRKVYKFVAFGNFDTDRDGVATPAEFESLTSLIQDWGGKLAPDLSGDVDFLVLGEEPVLPPKPGVDAPFEVVQAFIRSERQVQQYRNLLRQASATGIPVLNENRLYTLIGRVPGGR
ncbi:MAG: hypothetical protein SFZ23_14530 [Planctomycetota bacterium]|nr:hypothetical protein [Planctomycetota bacterium]